MNLAIFSVVSFTKKEPFVVTISLPLMCVFGLGGLIATIEFIAIKMGLPFLAVNLTTGRRGIS